VLNQLCNTTTPHTGQSSDTLLDTHAPIRLAPYQDKVIDEDNQSVFSDDSFMSASSNGSFRATAPDHLSMSLSHVETLVITLHSLVNHSHSATSRC